MLWRWLSLPLRWLLWGVRWPLRLWRRPSRGSWLRIQVGPRLGEVAPAARPWVRRWLPIGAPPAVTSLHELEAMLRAARSERRLDGVLLGIQPLATGWGRAWVLRRLLRSARAEGVRIVAHLPLGGGAKELFVASAASELWVEPDASLLVRGLGLERLYWGAWLRRWGVRVERFAAGRFKTAGEALSAERMSEGEREQLEALFEDLEESLREGLAERAKLADPRVLQTVRERLLLHGVEAVECGLAEAAVHEEHLAERLVQEGGASQAAEGGVPMLAAERYGRWLRSGRRPRLRSRRLVAVVRIEGLIAEGAGERGRVGRWLRALREVREEARYAALLLIINSPGGGATASDRLRAAVARVAERKPVTALLADVAASGGYLAAMGAGRLVAAPTTITGSIGVVAALPIFEALLERLGLRREAVGVEPHPGFLSPLREPSPQERERFEAHLQAHYRSFVRAVARARGRSEEEIHAVAQGRIWSGRAARRHGLVDELGGAAEALAWLRAEAGIGETEVELRPIGGGRAVTWAGAARGAGGAAPWWRDLTALLREEVLLLEPAWLGDFVFGASGEAG